VTPVGSVRVKKILLGVVVNSINRNPFTSYRAQHSLHIYFIMLSRVKGISARFEGGIGRKQIKKIKNVKALHLSLIFTIKA
jgi:hypothetical protein